MAMRIVQHMALLLVLLCSGVAAQSSDSCTSALISLSPCLNYITGNETNPSSSCCSQLASVVKAEPKCLCMVLNGGTSVGITVNQTQAMALPGACGVQTPPVSLCNSSGAPTGSPAPPSPTTPPLPTTPSSSSSSPSGGGSKAGPSADNTSGGCYTSIPASIFSHLLLFVAASIICFSSAKLI